MEDDRLLGLSVVKPGTSYLDIGGFKMITDEMNDLHDPILSSTMRTLPAAVCTESSIGILTWTLVLSCSLPSGLFSSFPNSQPLLCLLSGLAAASETSGKPP